MHRKIIRILSPKSWTPGFIVSMSITLVSLLLIYYFVRPIPPDTLTMTTGMEGGSFVVFAERYRQVLARDGIRVNLIPSSGVVENLRLLSDESHGVDASFIQGAIGKGEIAANLMSLGSLTYTPLWVFYRGDEILDDPSQLRGKRIAIGPKGSGIHKLSLNLLRAANAADPPTVLYEYSYNASMEAIMAGRVDAVMAFGSADSQMVTKLLHAHGDQTDELQPGRGLHKAFPGLVARDSAPGGFEPAEAVSPFGHPPVVPDGKPHRPEELASRPGVSAFEGLDGDPQRRGMGS